jgi:CBS domain-containing protein
MEMAYLVSQQAKRGCITIAETSTIQELATLLAKHNIGAVVVINGDNRSVGIVSERDIVRYLESAKEPDLNTKVSEIMSPNFISCGLATKSSELMELMTEHKIRHVPILDNDQLVGMVSIGDVVNRLIEIYAEENAQLRQYINT